MRTLYWDGINPLTGLPDYFDDPNLFWGDPSYGLEPGDPGFVPYANQIPLQTVHKPMNKHQRYYPTRDAEQIGWLQNFVAKLGLHATGLELTTQQVADIIADARWLIYVIGTWLPAVRAWQQACTMAVEQAEHGTGGTLALPEFVAPPLPAADVPNNLPAVVPRAEGALQRIFALVQAVKPKADAMTGEDLRIVGVAKAPPDFDTIKPEITGEDRADGVFLGWGWGGFGEFLDQCEIEVDRATGTFAFLTMDTTPGYLDTAPKPAQRSVWIYRAIYRVGDHRVGVMSDPVRVDVGGAA